MKTPGSDGNEPASHAAAHRASFRAPRLPAVALRNWPVSRRLVAVIVLALVMGLVFGSLRVAAAADTADSFARTTQLAILGERVTTLAQALENERDIQAGIAAAVDLESGVRVPKAQLRVAAAADAQLQPALQSAERATDQAATPVLTLIAQIGKAFPASTSNQAADAAAQINDLTGIRAGIDSQLRTSSIEPYSDTLDDLFALNDQITSGSADALLAQEVRTLGWIARAKDQASQQREILYGALIDDSWADVGGEDALTVALGLEEADLLEFQESASLAEQEIYAKYVAGPQVDDENLMINFVSEDGLPSLTGFGYSQSDAPQAWYSAMTTTIDKMRTVEQSLASAIVSRSQSLEQGARQSEYLAAGVTGGVLLLVLLATVIVARSLVDPLRRLQEDALEVATVRLPERVAELSEASDPQASMQIEPISVDSTDEIGKVARAFDQVHREALRLAGNEALLRGNLNAMFISLSRRSVPLIERLARMIDNLEQNEDDPDRLSNLFSMDHLVTRMRRNSENLLVLAGEEPVRKWSEPVPLADVARAAASEIEQYSRVVLNIQPGVAVSGQAAADVVHLLAEIIENATMFSPRDTPVHVSAQELSSGGVLIEVRDSGVGVSAARMAEMNWRLDNPPVIDVSVSRHMGLFAVSRLAARHGIRVRLRPSLPQGLSALVWLPGNLTGRLAVRPDDPSRLTAQAPLVELKVGGRRVHGRHRLGLRSAEDDQPGGLPEPRPEPVPARAPATSNWFLAKRPSAAAAQQADGIAAELNGAASGAGTNGTRSGGGTASGTGGWSAAATAASGTGGWSAAATAASGTGGWSDAAADGTDGWPDSGWQWTAEPVSVPVQGAQTAAGLPTRIPRANLFPGSAAGWQAGDNAATGGTPATFGQSALRYETEPQAQGPQAPQAPPRRSAEVARSRLSGFQLGSRDAQGRRPSA